MQPLERFPVRLPSPRCALSIGVGLGLILGLAVAPAAAAAGATARGPAREYVGLRVGMSREAAHERLERIGRAGTRESEDGESETWTLTDRRFGYVALSFDGKGLVRWFSLFARRGGRPVLIRSLGDPARAERKGNYIYVWSLPALAGGPACKVIARSQNPDTLQSLSVARAGENGPMRAAPADSAR